jgi:prevent-host-death family protein
MTTSKKPSTIGVTEIRTYLPSMLRQVEHQGERFIIQNHGRGVAALISLEDLALLERLEIVNRIP